jgi:hypothetical protein
VVLKGLGAAITQTILKIVRNGSPHDAYQIEIDFISHQKEDGGAYLFGMGMSRLGCDSEGK